MILIEGGNYSAVNNVRRGHYSQLNSVWQGEGGGGGGELVATFDDQPKIQISHPI